MPFEISPKFIEAPARVGRFQDFADALLAGCRVTYPITGKCTDGKGGACAMGAIFIGLGESDPLGSNWGALNHGLTNKMESIYYDRYGAMPASDNDSGRFTREQIAARIAAL